MKSMEITAVGIDVSKRKSTVAIRRPGGVIVACPFDISHSSHDLEKLVSILKTTGGDIRVVMEHTSNYWKPIALTLKNAGFYVSVVNAMLIHDFSDNSIRTLCATCLRHFVEAKAFKIALVPSADRSMDTCTVCQTRRGHDYVVMHR